MVMWPFGNLMDANRLAGVYTGRILAPVSMTRSAAVRQISEMSRRPRRLRCEPRAVVLSLRVQKACRPGGGLAARGAGATAQDAGDRLSQRPKLRLLRTPGVSSGAQSSRVC